MAGEIPEQPRINKHESGGTTYYEWEQPYSYGDAKGQESFDLQLVSKLRGETRIILIRASRLRSQTKSPATKIVFHEDESTRVYISEDTPRPGELSTSRRDWKTTTPDSDHTSIERMIQVFSERESALLQAGFEEETYNQIKAKLEELLSK